MHVCVLVAEKTSSGSRQYCNLHFCVIVDKSIRIRFKLEDIRSHEDLHWNILFIKSIICSILSMFYSPFYVQLKSMAWIAQFLTIPRYETLFMTPEKKYKNSLKYESVLWLIVIFMINNIFIDWLELFCDNVILRLFHNIGRGGNDLNNLHFIWNNYLCKNGYTWVVQLKWNGSHSMPKLRMTTHHHFKLSLIWWENVRMSLAITNSNMQHPHWIKFNYILALHVPWSSSRVPDYTFS